MKLEGLALAVVALTAAITTACASGGDGTPNHRIGAESNGPSGSGSCSSDCAGDDAGAGDALAAATGDSSDPFSAFDSGAGADAGTTVSSGGGSEGGTSVGCGLETTQVACASCCASSNPSGINTLNTAIMGCACGSAGPCATDCASEVCVDIPATSGDVCFTCLSSALGTGGSCYTSVQTACLADPGCSAYLSCESTECTGKP